MKIQLLTIFLAACISVGYARAPKKIINGAYIPAEIIPFQVSLQTRDGIPFCGGTIIDSTHILTAAHCIVNEFLVPLHDEIQVVTGMLDSEDRTPFNVFDVVNWVYHDNWVLSDSVKNDIAVLTVNRSIPLDYMQKAAELPTADINEGTRVIASGWGETTLGPDTEVVALSKRYLQKVEGYVIDRGMCQKFFDDTIYPGQLCVLYPRGGTCFGDSGGPLVNYKMQIVGIVSWGFPCGSLRYPDVFTNVYHYIDWIKEAISK